MRNKLFPLTTLWLVIFGLLNLFSSGRWTVAAATWVGTIFALRYLHMYPVPCKNVMPPLPTRGIIWNRPAFQSLIKSLPNLT